MRSKNLTDIRFRHLGGFTLLELLIVISIAGILLSISIPSYSNLVNQRRVEAAANSFKSAVALAGSESRKRGRVVGVLMTLWLLFTTQDQISTPAVTGDLGHQWFPL